MLTDPVQHAAARLYSKQGYAALQTEAARRRAAKGLCGYAGAIDVPGKPVGDDPDGELFLPIETALALHHRILLDKLEETVQTPHGRLMVLMPPGSAKSTYASVVMPSWYLSQPNRRIILGSYGDELARKMGRRTRSIIKQPRYEALFGCKLSNDSGAAQEFALTNGSEYMAAGLLTGVTGNRGHGIIIDDPVKGREQAESPTIRDKTWDEYNDSWLSRLIPGGWVVLIQTRWHEDDLAGRILPEGWKGESGYINCRDGNQWYVLCIQARCELDNDPLGRMRGDYLWPEWFDRKHWSHFEALPRTWGSLYQQIPTPMDGDLFKVGLIKYIEQLPAERISWVRGWDLAATEETTNAATAAVKMGIDSEGRVIVADVQRVHYDPAARDKLIRTLAELDGLPTFQSLPQDPGQAGLSQAQGLSKLLHGYRHEFTPESGDKLVRAEPFAAQVNVGNVYLLKGNWNRRYVEELRSAGEGAAFMDQVDASSRAYTKLTARGNMRISEDAMEQSYYATMDGIMYDTLDE